MEAEGTEELAKRATQRARRLEEINRERQAHQEMPVPQFLNVPVYVYSYKTGSLVLATKRALV